MLPVCQLFLSALRIVTYFILAPALRDRCPPVLPRGRGGNAGTEKCTNLFSVSQLGSGRARPVSS